MLILRGYPLLRICENKSRPVYRIAINKFSSSKVLHKEVKEEKDEPVQFSRSPAFNMNPHQVSGMKTTHDDQPGYQGPVVMISLICFMVYFFILREENDLDAAISGGSLFDHVEGLEKAQLEACILYYEKNGLDSRDLKARLQEVLEEEALAAQKNSAQTVE